MISELGELVDFIESSTDPTYQQKVGRLGDKRRELYNHLAKISGVDEIRVCQALYGKDSCTAFQKLKSRLYQNLLDILLLKLNVNISTDNSYNEIRDRCIRNLAVVNLFSRTSLYKNIEFLCKRTLITCEKYEMFDLATDLLKVLLNLYGTAIRDVKKFNLYFSKYREYSSIKIIEDELQAMYYFFFSSQVALGKQSSVEIGKTFNTDSLIEHCKNEDVS